MQTMAKSNSNNKNVSATFGDSALLLRADYDSLTSSLQVYFRSGGIYVYVGVPKKVFTDLTNAESAGSFFTENIKDSYDFMKQA